MNTQTLIVHMAEVGCEVQGRRSAAIDTEVMYVQVVFSPALGFILLGMCIPKGIRHEMTPFLAFLALPAATLHAAAAQPVQVRYWRVTVCSCILNLHSCLEGCTCMDARKDAHAEQIQSH